MGIVRGIFSVLLAIAVLCLVVGVVVFVALAGITIGGLLLVVVVIALIASGIHEQWTGTRRSNKKAT